MVILKHKQKIWGRQTQNNVNTWTIRNTQFSNAKMEKTSVGSRSRCGKKTHPEKLEMKAP